MATKNFCFSWNTKSMSSFANQGYKWNWSWRIFVQLWILKLSLFWISPLAAVSFKFPCSSSNYSSRNLCIFFL